MSYTESAWLLFDLLIWRLYCNFDFFTTTFHLFSLLGLGWLNMYSAGDTAEKKAWNIHHHSSFLPSLSPLTTDILTLIRRKIVFREFLSFEGQHIGLLPLMTDMRTKGYERGKRGGGGTELDFLIADRKSVV